MAGRSYPCLFMCMCNNKLFLIAFRIKGCANKHNWLYLKLSPTLMHFFYRPLQAGNLMLHFCHSGKKNCSMSTSINKTKSISEKVLHLFSIIWAHYQNKINKTLQLAGGSFIFIGQKRQRCCCFELSLYEHIESIVCCLLVQLIKSFYLSYKLTAWPHQKQTQALPWGRQFKGGEEEDAASGHRSDRSNQP